MSTGRRPNSNSSMKDGTRLRKSRQLQKEGASVYCHCTKSDRPATAPQMQSVHVVYHLFICIHPRLECHILLQRHMDHLTPVCTCPLLYYHGSVSSSCELFVFATTCLFLQPLMQHISRFHCHFSLPQATSRLLKPYRALVTLIQAYTAKHVALILLVSHLLLGIRCNIPAILLNGIMTGIAVWQP